MVALPLLHALPFLLLTCFPASRGARRDVLELTDTDFDYLAAEHETMLVLFYAPWCAHCKKLFPEFDKAATHLRGLVQLAKVDCTSQVDSCSRFGVSGFPTLKIFRSGRDSAPYDGPRTADGIFHYMKKQTGPDSVFLQTEEDFQTFINHYDASIIGVFAGESSAGLAEFLTAASLLRDQFRFAHCTEPRLGHTHGAQAESVLLVRPPRLNSMFENNVEIFTDHLTISSLRRFIRDKLFGLCPHLTLENRERLKVRDLLTVYYDVDFQHNARGSAYWRNRVMKVASRYAGRGLTFSVANKKDFLSELREEFGVEGDGGADLPLVTIRTRAGHKFTMREEFTRDGQSLERFLDSYFSGQLKRYIKSEPVPERNSAPVKVVVAESFDAVVKDPARDVLVLLYSPHCSSCRRLEPVYSQLGGELSSDQSIIIAKMNAIDNDVPSGYDVVGFPTIYFAPVGKKEEPIRYEGGRELKDFLKFLQREATDRLPLGAKEEL